MAHVTKIERLTLREMMFNLDLYQGLTDGLVQLPVPDRIKMRGKSVKVPADMEEFTSNICYGQRLFIVRKEENDFGTILRQLDGYYYPVISNKKWDEEAALVFGKYVLNCKIIELYPVAMHLATLTGQMAEREKSLLYREPTKVQTAAGIEKLNVFAELNALDFLRDAMKITVPEVLLTPYRECLVRFMNAKETFEFQERYFELIREISEPKKKHNLRNDHSKA